MLIQIINSFRRMVGG